MPALHVERRDLRPLIALSFCAGVICVAASYLGLRAPFEMGLRLAGAGLVVAVALLSVLQWSAQRRWRRLQALCSEAIALDPAPAVITDDALRLVARNPGARERFAQDDLSGIIGRFSAYPNGVMRGLLSQLPCDIGAELRAPLADGDDQVTLRRLASDLILWRFDEPLAHQASRAIPEDLALVLDCDDDGLVRQVSTAAQNCFAPSRQGWCVPIEQMSDGALVTLNTRDGTGCFAVQNHPHAGGRRLSLTRLHDDSARAGTRQQAWEMLPIPMLELRVDGTIVGANPAAHRLLQADVGPGARFSDFVEGLGRPLSDWLSEAARGQGAARSEFLRGVGARRGLALQVTLCRGCSGPNAGEVLALLHDVTEFKALEEQFVQSQKMQAIGQLAGGIAHDFNNLLTAISGHCDLLLLRHTREDPDYPDLVQIHQNANRAGALVGQLLAYSRKQELRLERIELRDCLADLTHLLNRLVGAQVQLALTHDGAVHCVMADRSQLEQVIMNLVVNARDAMDGRGEVRISTQLVQLDAPLTRDRATVAAGRWAVIHVQDTGCGIAPEMLRHVFEPFYTTKSVGEGTGLGLSTAYGIIKQTGGFIFVDSCVGEGTTFSVYLPAVARRALRDTPAPTRRAPRDDTGRVVMLVEDEAPVRAFASRALKLKGYEVIEADCGEAALEILEDKSLHVDLIISDVIMPGMDGPSWVAQARLARPDMRVSFMSGYAEDGVREHREAIPGAGFLAKPFSLQDLVDCAERMLES